jgi:hypothetical protein
MDTDGIRTRNIHIGPELRIEEAMAYSVRFSREEFN